MSHTQVSMSTRLSLTVGFGDRVSVLNLQNELVEWLCGVNLDEMCDTFGLAHVAFLEVRNRGKVLDVGRLFGVSSG